MSTEAASASRRWQFDGVPGWRDPRWGQVTALATFCVLGLTALHFEISVLEVVLTLATCVALDVGLTGVRRHRLVLPLSALISGLGLSLLLRSHHPVLFVVAAAAAILSKHFITTGGRHRFNPSNFGLVVALAFTTQGGIGMVTPGQWGRSWLLLFAILCVGSLVVFRAERLVLAGMFLIAEIGAHSAFHGSPDLAVSLSGAVLTFAFFMITDPKTAPRSWRGQAGYAVAIAVLGQWFTFLGSMAGPFVALFIVCALMPIVERLVAQPSVKRLLPSRSAATASA